MGQTGLIPGDREILTTGPMARVGLGIYNYFFKENFYPRNTNKHKN